MVIYNITNYSIGRATEVRVGWRGAGSGNPATLAEKCCMGGRKRAGLADPRTLATFFIFARVGKGLRGPRRPLQLLFLRGLARVCEGLADPCRPSHVSKLQGSARASQTLADPCNLETCEGLQGSARPSQTLADPRKLQTCEGCFSIRGTNIDQLFFRGLFFRSVVFRSVGCFFDTY